MKRILIFACLISISAVQISCDKKMEGEQSTIQDTASLKELKPTSIKFNEEVHDFGTINEGDIGKHTFTFTNTGDEPLFIKDAKGSCGCTTPAWTKDAIAAGGTGDILVEFNSNGRPGDFTKTVTVFANTDPEGTIITIKGHVTGKEKEITGPYEKEAK